MYIEKESHVKITEKKKELQILLKEDLRNELVTREIFDERFESMTRELEQRFESMTREFDERFNGFKNEIYAIIDGLKNEIYARIDGLKNEIYARIDGLKNEINERFSLLNYKLNIFIAIALLSLTLANPIFVELIKMIFFK